MSDFYNRNINRNKGQSHIKMSADFLKDAEVEITVGCVHSVDNLDHAIKGFVYCNTMNKLQLEVKLYILVCSPHRQKKEPPFPSLWDNSFGLMRLWKSVVSQHSPTQCIIMAPLYSPLKSFGNSVSPKWEPIQFAHAQSATLNLQHIPGSTTPFDLSINNSYNAQYWIETENLNWNRISFTINSLSGSVYDLLQKQILSLSGLYKPCFEFICDVIFHILLCSYLTRQMAK